MEPTTSEEEVTQRSHPVAFRSRAWLKRLFTPGESLSQRVVRGGFWVFALRIVTRLFGLVRTIVLARLLAPEDFGLFGIALLGMSALETFSQTGFQPALVQKKEDIKPYLDTAWTIQAIRGAILALILFGIGPHIAAFFATPAAAALVRVLGLSVLFLGFTNIGVVYFQKELEFHKQFFYQLSGTLADFVVAITAAVMLRNAWALIFGLLVGNFVRMGVSYLIHPYRPRLQLDKAKAKKLYDFGRWILGSSVLLFLITEGDDIFVGKLLGATALGFYQLAYRISNMPATEITHVISGVTFPAYSKLQSDLPKLREAYLRTAQLVAFISIPLTGGILVLSPELTRILLGNKWMAMVPAMQVLVLWGAIRSIGATMGPVFQATGNPDILTKLSVIRLTVLVILIYPLSVKGGITGTSLAVLISALFTMPVTTWMLMSRILRGNTGAFLKTALLIPFISTVLMALLLTLVAGGGLTLAELGSAIVAGIAFYSVLAYGLDRVLGCGIRNNLTLTISESIK